MHKRAWKRQGVLLEAFLVSPDAETLVTNIFGAFLFVWPRGAFSSAVELFQEEYPYVGATFRLYQARHSEIEKAYKNHVLKDTAIGRGRRELPLRGTGI